MIKVPSVLLLSLMVLPCSAQRTVRSYAHSSSRPRSSRSYARSGVIHVPGHVNRDGKYVQPYYRTHPNGTQYDNYSSKGNVNPYTGKVGTKTPTH